MSGSPVQERMNRANRQLGHCMKLLGLASGKHQSAGACQHLGQQTVEAATHVVTPAVKFELMVGVNSEFEHRGMPGGVEVEVGEGIEAFLRVRGRCCSRDTER